MYVSVSVGCGAGRAWQPQKARNPIALLPCWLGARQHTSHTRFCSRCLDIAAAIDWFIRVSWSTRMPHRRDLVPSHVVQALQHNLRKLGALLLLLVTLVLFFLVPLLDQLVSVDELERKRHIAC